MTKLMTMKNGQSIVTIPKAVVRILALEKGDEVNFRVDIRKSKVWIEKG